MQTRWKLTTKKIFSCDEGHAFIRGVEIIEPEINCLLHFNIKLYFRQSPASPVLHLFLLYIIFFLPQFPQISCHIFFAHESFANSKFWTVQKQKVCKLIIINARKISLNRDTSLRSTSRLVHLIRYVNRKAAIILLVTCNFSYSLNHTCFSPSDFVHICMKNQESRNSPVIFLIPVFRLWC